MSVEFTCAISRSTRLPSPLPFCFFLPPSMDMTFCANARDSKHAWGEACLKRSVPCLPSHLKATFRHHLDQHDWSEETTRGTRPRVEHSHSSSCVRNTMPTVLIVRTERATSTTVLVAREAQLVPTVPFLSEERSLGRQDPCQVI